MYNEQRARKRFSPASTYKLPHTLFALDAGVVKNSTEIFKWDGIQRSYSPHNQDHTLASAMRYSAVWVFDLLARRLGKERAQAYLSRTNYGNENPNTRHGSYWIDGELAISTYEQIRFLRQLNADALPFDKAHQQLLKRIIRNKQGVNWALYAKTGWQGNHGWWIGWVENNAGTVYFAMNIDTPARSIDLFKRKAIVKDILRSLDVKFDT